MSSITHLFVAGGFVMYPLVIFLVVTLMIGIERFFLYRKFRKDMRQFTAVLNNHPGWIMLPTVLERDTQNLGTLFAKALRSAKNYNGLENRLQDLVGYTDERLKRGLGWLSMIVTMAPARFARYRSRYDSRFCRCRRRYWSAYHHHRWCIRSLSGYCNRSYGGYHCPCFS